METELSSLLNHLGVYSETPDYRYLEYAISIFLENPLENRNFERKIYPEIEKHFKISHNQAKNHIRRFIIHGWSKWNSQLIHEIFQHSLNAETGTPTCTEFIITIADYLIILREDRKNKIHYHIRH